MRLTNLPGSKLAMPCTFTAEIFGNQFGFPRNTSPRIPRICDVNGATTTKLHASPSEGTASTNTDPDKAAAVV